jgi:nucleoside-diphosphate-sugar epimerase
MIIAITGGRGFIGKLLVKKYLNNKHQIRILSRKVLPKNEHYTSFIGDLTNPKDDLSSFLDGVDILYHCAGEVVYESLMNELHINGTKRLISQAEGKVKLWVQLSSVGVYGKCRNGVVTEESKEQPNGVYETSKTISDNLVKESGIPFTILRPSNVFGKGMPNQSLYKMFSMISKGMFFYIGKKGAILNYIHIDDVVDALIKCGESRNAIGEVFNISQTILIEKMINSIMEELDIERKFLRFPEWLIRMVVFVFRVVPRFPLKLSRVDALTGMCIYNSKKIQKLLGFKFATSLEENFKLFIKEK